MSSIIQSTILQLLDRGSDLLIDLAEEFVRSCQLHSRLRPNQMNALKSVFHKYSSVYDITLSKSGERVFDSQKLHDLKGKVNQFIRRQAERDAKSDKDSWAVVGEPLFDRIFSPNKDEVEQVAGQIKRLLEKQGMLSRQRRYNWKDIFNPRKEAYREWIEGEFQYHMASSMFSAILAVYRCKIEGMPLRKIKE